MLGEVWVVISVVYGVFPCRFEVGGVGLVGCMHVCCVVLYVWVVVVFVLQA